MNLLPLVEKDIISSFTPDKVSTWPSEDRLTDTKWKEMLENDKAPAPPFWTQSYTAPREGPVW